MTPPIEAEEVTTPDVPSSSPGIDAMDVSPLPHKAPYFVAQIALTSPSPEGTPCVDEMSCYPSIAHQQPILQARSSQTSTFLQLPEYAVFGVWSVWHALTIVAGADDPSHDHRCPEANLSQRALSLIRLVTP